MMSKGKWLQFIVVGLGVLWLLRFPPTRALIVWLLPLGSGWDDLVAMILIVVVVVVLVIKNVGFGRSFKSKKRAFKNFFKD